MSCHDFDFYLQEQLDGIEAGLPAGLSEHLASCARCRDLQQASRLLQTGLRAMPRPTPSPDLTARIVRSVLAERRKRVVVRFRMSALAAAAALLLAFPLLSYFLSLSRPTDPTLGTGASVAKNQKPVVPVPVTPDREKEPDPQAVAALKANMANAGSAVVSLSQKVADKTRTNAALLWSLASPSEFPSLEVVVSSEPVKIELEPAGDSLKEATVGLSTGAELVANSAQRAVNLFGKEFPIFKKSTPRQERK